MFPLCSRRSLLKGTPINVMHLIKQQAGQFLMVFNGVCRGKEGSPRSHVGEILFMYRYRGLSVSNFIFYQLPPGLLELGLHRLHATASA